MLRSGSKCAYLRPEIHLPNVKGRVNHRAASFYASKPNPHVSIAEKRAVADHGGWTPIRRRMPDANVVFSRVLHQHARRCSENCNHRVNNLLSSTLIHGSTV